MDTSAVCFDSQTTPRIYRYYPAPIDWDMKALYLADETFLSSCLPTSTERKAIVEFNWLQFYEKQVNTFISLNWATKRLSRCITALCSLIGCFECAMYMTNPTDIYVHRSLTLQSDLLHFIYMWQLTLKGRAVKLYSSPKIEAMVNLEMFFIS